MNRIFLFVLFSCLVTTIRAEDAAGPFSELDSKISKNLARDTWDLNSVKFVQNLWEDYKASWRSNKDDKLIRVLFGKMPDAASYDQYIGAYGPSELSSQIILEITKDREGRFFVKLKGHNIPAVKTNKCIVFTTGDVVYSTMPQFADKAYCTLEMHMVISIEGKFYLADLISPPEKWLQVAKIKKKE